VAPVKIGDRAYVGSGSVVTKNVPPDALAVSRGQQTTKPGWAKRLRQLKGLGKKKAKTPTK
jgi:bifunctional UDP-N-acetylglucosamine pyrophosphorylase/glucosamine-1-phosphate N-acetyltransferase